MTPKKYFLSSYLNTRKSIRRSLHLKRQIYEIRKRGNRYVLVLNLTKDL